MYCRTELAYSPSKSVEKSLSCQLNNDTIILAFCIHAGFVRLDYQRLIITSTSVEIHVLPHSSPSCRTIPLTVETYNLNQLSGDAFNVSRVLSRVQHASDNSNTFLVPWENTANGEGFIFRVGANFCATDETMQLLPASTKQ